MKVRASSVLTVLATSIATAGCGEPANTDTQSTTVSPTGSNCSTQVTLQDINNYSLTTDVSIRVTALKGASDLVFDWSDLTTDFFGHAVNAAEDVDLVLLSLWNMAPEDLEHRISTDTLSPNEQKGALTIYPDGTFTSRNLYTFNVFDRTNTPVDANELKPYFDTTKPDYAFPPNEYTFLVIASTGTSPGQNARMLSMFKLDTNSTETTLKLDNSATSLLADASFANNVPVAVPAATPNVVLNWKSMTHNALGNPFEVRQITKAVVLHFDTATLPELEGDFLNLESRADEWYEGEVAAGTSVDLSTLVDANAGNFSGVTDEGTWMVALFCTKTCNNPAPWSIGILKPCASM